MKNYEQDTRVLSFTNELKQNNEILKDGKFIGKIIMSWLENI